MSQPLNNSSLHYAIMRHSVDYGYAPEVTELCEHFGEDEAAVTEALTVLSNDHGVVLHPNSSKIWVIHPFSLAPTNFLVKDGELEWWGNCAWCSLGIVGLLDKDATITTTLGANGKQIDVHVKDGKVVKDNLYVHFPVPMKNVWDNVIYTCSTMLLFENEVAIDTWCEAHRIRKGDVQPIDKVFEFAKVWYGKHLDPDWVKWSAEEAAEIFERFGLTDPIWDIPVTDSRF